MSLRILHISTRLILGGSQENTILSCEGQARLGHEVHLAFGPIFGPEGSMLERVEQFNTSDGRTITTHEIPALVRQLGPIRDHFAAQQIQRLIASIKPDIVHTHSSKAGVLGRIAAWRVRKAGLSAAIVHTIHGPPFMPIEGSLLVRLKTRAINALYTLAERYAAKRCHAIVSVADAMTEQFLARGIGRPDLYTTVRSGMEIEPFLNAGTPQTRARIRSDLGLNTNDFVVGTVARLAKHKGHDDLLDALGDDLRTNPSWKLLWVGDGWWHDRLMHRVAEMGLTGQVITTGLVDPTRIAELMVAMDVLAHPSSREGLPRTVPQALLSGVLPVAYDVDGTGEVCKEMVTGRLVPLGDRVALREAIRWAANHQQERAGLVATGRTLCEREFSAQLMVDRLEEVYQRAIERAGASKG